MSVYQGHHRFYPFTECISLYVFLFSIALTESNIKRHGLPILRALRKNVSEFVTLYDIDVTCYDMAKWLITKLQRLRSTDGGTERNLLGFKTLQQGFIIEYFRCKWDLHICNNQSVGSGFFSNLFLRCSAYTNL